MQRGRSKMRKGLLKKIFVGGLIVGAGLGFGSCTRTYNIDGKNVKDRHFLFHTIVEKDETGTIVYSPDRGAFGEDVDIFVNGIRYTPKNTLYQKYKERYDYLQGKIDSTKNAEKESKLNEKDDSWVRRK